VTAIAGAITAIAGLILALQQVGVFADKDDQSGAVDAASVQEPAAAAAPSGGVSAATVGNRRSVTFPAGTTLSLRSSRADATYDILGTRVDDRNTGMLSVTFTIRLTNTGRLDLNFWNDLFRLSIDGVPRAPTNFLNEIVAARSAKEGDVTFDVPVSAKTLVLSIDNREDRGELPVVLK
jgi:hypothetical protein